MKGRSVAAAIWAACGAGAMLAAFVAGGLAPRSQTLFWGISGFAAFVLCGRRAAELWQLDGKVFDHERRIHTEGKPRTTRLPAVRRSHGHRGTLRSVR